MGQQDHIDALATCVIVRNPRLLSLQWREYPISIFPLRCSSGSNKSHRISFFITIIAFNRFASSIYRTQTMPVLITTLGSQCRRPPAENASVVYYVLPQSLFKLIAIWRHGVYRVPESWSIVKRKLDRWRALEQTVWTCSGQARQIPISSLLVDKKNWWTTKYPYSNNIIT